MPVSDQGNLRGRYTLIPRTLIFITCGERVLLIKGAPTKRLWANLYNGIGGHVERGEDILSATKRELQEETGLEGISLRLCGTVVIDTGTDTGIGLYIFKGEVGAVIEVPADDIYFASTEEQSCVGLESLSVSEEGSLEWIQFDRIETLPLVEDLHILLPRLLGMEPEEAPFSAYYQYDEAGKMLVRFSD